MAGLDPAIFFSGVEDTRVERGQDEKMTENFAARLMRH
jgi:hypothetical protein